MVMIYMQLMQISITKKDKIIM